MAEVIQRESPRGTVKTRQTDSERIRNAAETSAVDARRKAGELLSLPDGRWLTQARLGTGNPSPMGMIGYVICPMPR